MTFPMPFSVQKALLFSFLHPQVRFERSAVQQKVIQLPLLFGSLLCFDFIKVNWLFLTRTTRRLSFFSFGFRFLICLINSVCKICLINSANMSWTPSRFKPFKGEHPACPKIWPAIVLAIECFPPMWWPKHLLLLSMLKSKHLWEWKRSTLWKIYVFHLGHCYGCRVSFDNCPTTSHNCLLLSKWTPYN